MAQTSAPIGDDAPASNHDANPRLPPGDSALDSAPPQAPTRRGAYGFRGRSRRWLELRLCVMMP